MVLRFLPDIRYVEARNYTHTPGSNGTVNRIVIHDMEMPKTGTTAESCARMFATTTRQASAHFVVDNDSTIQCVPLDCKAWHAPPNAGSIGIEHAGYARQTSAQWLNSFGIAMLTRSAQLTAHLCILFNIPVRKLSASDLKNGKRGICGHADVSAAWHQTDHTDPGPNFPWTWYLQKVQEFASTKATKEETELDAQQTQQAVWYYPLDENHVNPLTMISRTYDAMNKLTAALDPVKLAQAIAEALPAQNQVDAQALTQAVAQALAKRLES